MNNPFNGMAPGQIVLFALAIAWTLVWKGFALWKAARKADKWWFIVLLLPINTIGILEILYFFFFGNRKSLAGKEE